MIKEVTIGMTKIIKPVVFCFISLLLVMSLFVGCTTQPTPAPQPASPPPQPVGDMFSMFGPSTSSTTTTETQPQPTVNDFLSNQTEEEHTEQTSAKNLLDDDRIVPY